MRAFRRWWHDFVSAYTDDELDREPTWAWAIRVGSCVIVLVMAATYFPSGC